MTQNQTKPILYSMTGMRCLPSHWALGAKVGAEQIGRDELIVQPIGDDPRGFGCSSDLDIWDAYETIHS